MSHLKEPVVINFTATNLGNDDYVLIHYTPYRFKFNENFYGSYGWIPAANYPNADIVYYIRNETTDTVIGTMTIDSSTGGFDLVSTASAAINIAGGETISISCPATNNVGRFGVSLVGER